MKNNAHVIMLRLPGARAREGLSERRERAPAPTRACPARPWSQGRAYSEAGSPENATKRCIFAWVCPRLAGEGDRARLRGRASARACLRAARARQRAVSAQPEPRLGAAWARLGRAWARLQRRPARLFFCGGFSAGSCQVGNLIFIRLF